MTTRTKPKNLSGTTRLLREMVANNELRVKHFGPTDPDFFFLPKTKAVSLHGKLHERLCGDLYVAYQTLDQTVTWERPTDYEENLALGLFPDRRMTVGNQIVFWEVDRGTEDYVSDKGITGKLEKYIRLAQTETSKPFSVVFTTVDAKQSAKARAARILELFERYSRSQLFFVTLHRWAVEEPLAAVFMSAANPQGVSILPAP